METVALIALGVLGWYTLAGATLFILRRADSVLVRGEPLYILRLIWVFSPVLFPYLALVLLISLVLTGASFGLIPPVWRNE